MAKAGKTSKGGATARDKPDDKPKKPPPPAASQDDDYEDGDIATPKLDR